MSDPTTSSPPRSKRATRQTLRARREAMAEGARAEAAAVIAAAVDGLLDGRLAAGDVLGLYAAKGSEVDTALIAAHAARRGVVVAYPRVVEGDRVLAFHVADERDLVIAGRLGLREPVLHAESVELARIAAFVIPGLAFDRSGGRIGWGMGHYDATLVHAPAALRVGIAFECQIVEHVPHDPHDVAMNYVVTEVAAYAVA